MINYIIQVILFQILFLAIYDFFLSRETFFTKNRWYLLVTPIISFFIPLIKISTLEQSVPEEFIVNLPEIMLSPEKVITEAIPTESFTNSINYLSIFFWVGVVIFTLLFLIKLVKIASIIKKYDAGSLVLADAKLIIIPSSSKAFSFFNYIFLGAKIKEANRENIIQHELVHTQQKHTYDLVVFEILKIAMWFNPMIYFYQKRITLVHEYISDAVVAKSETKESYINNLLSGFFQVENIEFVNQYSKKSFIKKRIMMMKKNQSKTVNQLKYLLLIPVLVSMLFYSSCSNDNIEVIEESKSNSQKAKAISYFELNGKLTKSLSDKSSYLDRYFGNGIPEGIELTYDDLTNEEREEYDVTFERMKSIENEEYSMVKTIKIFEKTNGRKTLAIILKDFKDIKVRSKKREPLSDGSYSVLHVNTTPTFAGCEVRDLDCFFKKIEEHFSSNFDTVLANSLNLPSGKTKAYVSFNIDLNGEVADVKVRAPHKIIEKEVKRVLQQLPIMTIGKIDDKPVKVRYTLPFVFNVE
ncbi:M56 family metallopeptidase [Polaribacter sp. MED152]|uniref:M56 family metallopeptidase n=1 Tax=Polaribacter sp. MED152 TaxID=313598 RepID=UPI00006899EB|nr:M56 family metallopeptidase [Polaribacter sp. MED152]EAQ40775.1 BlaR1 peptidase M56 [Polaribacter sp. MED152]